MVVGSGLGYRVYGYCIGIRIGLGVMGSELALQGQGCGIGVWGCGVGVMGLGSWLWGQGWGIIGFKGRVWIGIRVGLGVMGSELAL